MKIASWNVNSLKVRLPHLEEWLKLAQPDIVALQETKLEDHAFPDAAIAALGYQCVHSGQKTYNRVAVLPGPAPRDPRAAIPAFADEQARNKRRVEVHAQDIYFRHCLRTPMHSLAQVSASPNVPP